MAGQMTISTQIEPGLKAFIIEDAENRGMSISEWLNEAISEYIDNNTLSWDDLAEMELEELQEVIDDSDLDLEVEDYKKLLGYDLDELRNDIANELGIESEDEYAYEYEDED